MKRKFPVWLKSEIGHGRRIGLEWTAALLIVPAVTGASSGIAIASHADVEMPSSGQVSVPAKNGVEFDATIDGKGPFRLIFDTGAGVNVLSPAFAQQLGLRPEGERVQFSAVGGSVKAQAAHVETLRIGDLALHDQTFYILPMPWGDGHGPVGAVGYELMQELAVKVDYENQQLTFYRPASFTYRGSGVKVSLEAAQRAIEVAGKVNDIQGVFTIDTGDEASLGLEGWFVQQNDLVRQLAPRYQGYSGSGAGGPMPAAYYARVKKLLIGEAEADDVITYLFNGPAVFGESAGNIGTRVLRQFNITFDRPHDVLYLEKNSNWGKPGIFNRAGIVVDSIQQDNTVKNVLQGSLSALAGVAIGDVILQIDGRAPNDDPLQQDDPAFLGPAGTRVRLTIKRGRETQKITLMLKDPL